MRRLLVWLAVVVVLGAGGWFGDAALRDQAQRQAAVALADELTATGVDVQLGGWPFAMAVVTRSVPSAEITAGTVTLDLGGKRPTLSDVRMTTGEIVLAGNELRASAVTGSAALDYRSLEKLTGVPVSYAGDGRLGLSYPVTVLGRRITIGVSAMPVLDATTATIRLTEPQADLNGTQVGLPIDQSLVDSLVTPIDVSLDRGLHLTGISPSADGLGLAFAAEQVSVPLK